MKCNKRRLSSKLLAVFMCSLFVVATRHANAAAPVGFVHRSGSQIVNGSGQSIKLRGVNLGGMLLWEGWLFGMSSDLLLNSGRHAETYIVNRLAEKIPMTEVQAWRQNVYANGIRAQDFQRIAQLGYNVVRLPFNHVVLEDDANPFVYKASGWALLDSIMSWAETCGVYVVLDLHSAPGGQSPYFIADPDGGQARLWDNTTNNKQRTIELWRAIASRYANRTIVAGYDLLNEPIPPSGADLVSLDQQIVTAIRQVDPNHMILVEGAAFATDFSIFTGPLDANQAYSFHQYTTVLNEDRQAQLNTYGSIALAHNLPLWNGEFGVNTYSVMDSTVAMYEDPLNGVDGQSFWTWKRVPGSINNFPTLRQVLKPASWQPVLDWLDQAWFANPTADQIRQGLADFLVQLRLENTSEDASMVAALQPNGRPPGGPAWQSPTATVSGWGDGFESNPTGAFADGGTVAVNPNNVGDSQNYYNYNFVIPSGAIIDGIEVRVDHSVDAVGGAPALAIALSNDGGFTWTTNRSVPIASTTERTDIVGWSQDLWGKSWTASSFSNTNFRVGVATTCVNSSACSGVRDFYLDYVAVRVFYH